MSDQSHPLLAICLGSLDGQCLRRAALLGIAVKRAALTRSGRAVDAPKAAARVAAERDLQCDAAQGLPCSHARLIPTFDGHELRLGKTLLRQFQRHCKQTEVLDAFQSRGWPAFIDNPFGGPSPFDPENGLSDIVYELNQQRDSCQQIHFWCDGDRVRWEIVGQDSVSK